MRRDPALVSLSHDHQHALAAALRLRRATAGDLAEATAAFQAFWAGDGREHFRVEEEILLPAYAAVGPADHPLVARTLCEHVEIRALAAALERTPTVDGANALGERLAEHVRLEERELFPLIERTLDADALAELAAALP
jgi:hypothetical protein